MPDQVLPGIYRTQVPLPGNPLKAINSYVIKGRDRSLVIDTGMNREVCLSAFMGGLNELGIELSKVDFFITHLHADHIGLVARIAPAESIVYFNEPDSRVINSESHWEGNRTYAALHGFPTDERDRALARHPGRIYHARGKVNFHAVHDGDKIEIGDYSFQCVATPGHTTGHTCLYDPGKRIFISGDHILTDITPNISLWADDEDPLADYLNSLDKVSKLDVAVVVPGHRDPFTNCQERIAELKQHHKERLEEVLSILGKNGGLDIFSTASRMTWDMDYKSWSDFPPQQKWFAFGEAAAHLKYLEGKGLIKREDRGNEVIFRLA